MTQQQDADQALLLGNAYDVAVTELVKAWEQAQRPDWKWYGDGQPSSDYDVFCVRAEDISLKPSPLGCL